MLRRTFVTTVGAAVAATTIAGTTIGLATADAATIDSYFGYAGGSQIRVADALISSDLTAQSVAISAGDPVSDSKSTAAVHVSGILDTGVITTSSAITRTGSVPTLTTTARTAGLSLLGGLITADAVTSVSTVSHTASGYTASSKSTFVNLHIAGVTLPLTIPQNFGVSIPGVATVSLNSSLAAAGATGAAGIGAGVSVTLLHDYNNANTGAQIYVAPTFASVNQTEQPPATGHVISGAAYATKVSARATSAVQVTSDPTAQSGVPYGGGGKTISSSIASVNVLTAVNVGAGVTTATGTNTSKAASAATSTKIASISLLGGLIKADAVTVNAAASVTTGKATTSSGSTSIANLVIAGKTIPVSVSPNTTISLGALGKVVLNEQIKTSTGISVRALHVVLSTASSGLDVGAEIEVGVATAYAT